MTYANPILLSAVSRSRELTVGRTDGKWASDLAEAATIMAADRRAMDGGCTEAVRYGGLSGLIGRVSLDWAMAGQGDRRRPFLTLLMRDGPVVKLPTQRGSGSRLVGCALAQEPRGEMGILFEPEGMTCVIDAPLPPQAKQLEIAA